MFIFIFIVLCGYLFVVRGTLANSEYPDEMPHNAAFHLGIHCLLRQNRSSEKEI